MSEYGYELHPTYEDRVNLTDDLEVRYWVDKFGVSEDELRRAVHEVGRRSDVVAHALRNVA